MNLFGSPLPGPEAKKALEIKCPASRSDEDLERIFAYVIAKTDILQDEFWNFLSMKNKKHFCRFMHYHHIHSENGETIELPPKGNRNSTFYILVRGKKANLIVHHPSNNSTKYLPLDGMHGVCMGNVYMANCLTRLISIIARRCNLQKGIHQQFIEEHSSRIKHSDTYPIVCVQKPTNNVLLTLGRGSSYIKINNEHCRPFIQKLQISLLHRKILRFIPLSREDKTTHPISSPPSDFEDTLKSSCSYKIARFPAGKTILQEGTEKNQIIILLNGLCVLTQEMSTATKYILPFLEQENMKYSKEIKERLLSADDGKSRKQLPPICYVGSMSILGFIPYFLARKDLLQTSKIDDKRHNRERRNSWKKDPSASTDDSLSSITEENSDDGSLLHPFTIKAHSDVHALIISKANLFVEILWNTNHGLAQAFVDLAVKQINWLKKSFPLVVGTYFKWNMEKNPEDNPFDELPLTAEDFQEIISTMCPNPKLNRHKVLDKLRKLLGSENYENYDTASILHETSLPESQSDDDSNIPKDKIIGLQPYPTILLSRKLHGKTLPVIERSDGYLCPFDIDKEIHDLLD